MSPRFMPCTPNPTTGFFFYVLRKDLVVLDISVENAMTLLISAGMVQPDAARRKRKLAALAATARTAQAAREDGSGGVDRYPARISLIASSLPNR